MGGDERSSSASAPTRASPSARNPFIFQFPAIKGRGFCATLAAAITVVLASRTAMPVSTTHIAVGAVMGVGLARGIAALDLRVIGSIVVSWVVTLPASGVVAALLFFLLKAIFS